MSSYAAGRGMNHYDGVYQGGRYPPQQYNYYEEDDEEKEEMQRLMMNLRKVVLPQLEQLIAYMIIPMIGSWIFKKINVKEPKLPSVNGISICRACKVPVDYWMSAFVKTG